MLRRLSALLLVAALLLPGVARASQTTLTTPGAPLTMAQLATFLNNAFGTIGTNYSGSTPPAVCTGGTACTYQFWMDTSTSPRVLRVYDGASWVTIGSLNTTSHSFLVPATQTPNTQTGTTYTVTDADNGSLLRFTNSGSIAVTQPQAGAASSFNSGWYADYRNAGTGTVTITPATSTIDGAASLVLPPGRSVRIVSDGTNYFANETVGTPTTAVLGGVFSKAAVSSNWLRSLGTDGIFTASQPAASDLSNGVTGSGAVVLATSPTITSPSLTTPAIGVATGTSLALSGCTLSPHTFCSTGSIAATGNIWALNTTAIPAGGTTGSGFRLSSSTDFGIFPGSGAPTLSALQGSLYLRSDGVPYYNTNSSTGWNTVLVTGGALGTPSSGTLTNATGLPVSTGISGLGTGVATALAVNVGSAGAFVTFNGALGTPSSGTLTNATGLPISTGVSGLGAGVATFLGTPSSANLAAAVTGETGSGALVFATSPALVTPDLGTPSAGVLTNATGLPVATGISGLGTGVATALAVNVGSAGAFVTFNGALGTPSSGTLTNATGLPISTGVSGLGANVATFLATPSSANFAAAVTGETGSGGVVFDTAPTISAAILTGLADVQGAIKFSTQSAPAQITANQNNYNPSSVVCATSATLLINSDAARDITGMAGGVAGCEMALINNGSFAITLKEESGSSTAGNRFKTGGDIAIASSGAVPLRYDGVASRWRLLGAPASGGGGSGTVTSVVGGDGLNGGTITTSGTLSVKFSRSFLLPL